MCQIQFIVDVYFEGFNTGNSTLFSLVFKAGKRALKFGSIVIDINGFFDSNVTPM